MNLHTTQTSQHSHEANLHNRGHFGDILFQLVLLNVRQSQ